MVGAPMLRSLASILTYINPKFLNLFSEQPFQKKKKKADVDDLLQGRHTYHSADKISFD